MKKFHLKIIVFLILIGITYILTFFIFKKYFHEKKWNELPKHEVLFIGDSHLETSINDQLFENSLNFSKSGDCYLYSYLKLKKIIEYNKKLKTVFLPIDYHNLSEKSMNYYKKNDILESKLPLNLYFSGLTDFNVLFKINPYSSTKSLFNCLSYKYIVQKPYLNQLGGFVKLQKVINEKDKAVYEKDFNLNYNKHQINYLKKIKSICQANKINFYLITVPKYNHPNILIERKHIKDFVKKYNYNWLNFDELPQLNDSCFSDIYHLNKYGADKFTPILKNYLDSL